MKRILLAILVLALSATPAFAAFGGDLEVNAATDVKIGPFVDVGDGFTPQTDIGDPDVGNDLDGTDESYLIKHSAADNGAVQMNSSGQNLTWDQIDNMDGWYNLSLTASAVDTEGMLTIVIQDDSDCLPVSMHYMVLSEAAYNSKYGVDDDDTGYMRVDFFESADVGQTGNDNGADINNILTDTGAYDTDAEHASAVWGAARSSYATGNTFGGDALDNDVWTNIIAGYIDEAVSGLATPAEVNAQMVDVLTVDTIAEFTAKSEIGANPTFADAVLLPYMMARNQTQVTANEWKLFNDAGTEILDKELTDDGSTFQSTEIDDDD